MGIKSLFGRHLCLFEVVSLDLLPFVFTIESKRDSLTETPVTRPKEVRSHISVLFCFYLLTKKMDRSRSRGEALIVDYVLTF